MYGIAKIGHVAMTEIDYNFILIFPDKENGEIYNIKYHFSFSQKSNLNKFA